MIGGTPAGEPFPELEVAGRHRLRQEVAALDVQIAGECPEHGHRPGGVKGIELHVQAVAVDDAGRPGGGVEAGRLPDCLPGPARCPAAIFAAGNCAAACCSSVEADGPVRDKIRVIQILA